MHRQYPGPVRYVSLLLLIMFIGVGMRPLHGGTCESRSSLNGPIVVATAEADSAERAAFRRALQVFTPAMNAQDSGESVNFAALRSAMKAFWVEFPTVHRSATLLTFYMDMFSKAHPDSIQAEWASFAGCSSPVASALARGKVRFTELQRQPLEIAFVSLDGRSVDLRALRGNVVLIDFWATWCAPCVKQVPALKRLYSEHHKHGFEIIGVSLDREEDKQKLVEFVAREGMSWPEHFGGGWQNEFVVRYAVNSVPTTFLLDTTGRLVGISLTEDDLENEVKRLLRQRSLDSR